jgi:hypothetical protein
MAICISCEEDYNDKRLALGYQTCLNCGELEARGIIAARTHAKLCEMTPYVSGSMTQPDALFERRSGENTPYKGKEFVVGE